jgi:hypothetical protein
MADDYDPWGLNQTASDYGFDPQFLRQVIKIESGGNPNNRTGSYKGLLQLSDQEFNANGGGNIYDPVDNLRAGAKKLAAERDAFEAKYGRPPTPTDIYMLHQQGAGGYAQHLANPEAPAWQNMLNTGEGRQKGEGWAKRAIWGNIPDQLKQKYGSVDNVSSSDFIGDWRNKIEGDIPYIEARASGSPPGLPSQAGGFGAELASGSPAGMPVQAADDFSAIASMRGPRMANEAPGLLASLTGQQQQGGGGIGGLLGSLNPEKMAYLAMIAKGLNPYTDVDPTKMLQNAQLGQQHAATLAQQRAEHAADRELRQQQIDINTRRQAFEETQANVTPAAKAAADFGFTKDSGKGPGTPEYQDFMKSFYQLKGEGYKAVDIKDPSTGEARTVFQKGDQFFTPDQLGLGAPASGGNPYSASGKMTADEGKSALYADRAATAHANITKYENINNQPGGTVGGLIQQNLPAGVANVLVSGERGSSIDAQRAFINALLRRESGAAIAKSEFDSYGREYFPQLGDTPAQIEDKRKHRAEVIAGLAREAGRGYRPGYSFDEAGNIATGKPSYTGKSGGGASSPQAPSERKTINGKGYSKIGGQWYED